MSATEDNALIDRFLKGDEAGFELLVRKYQNRVVCIVYSLTGSNPHAEDIAQDVFIKVYQNLAGFEKKSAFSTWLYRITVNTTYNHLRSKRVHVSLDDIDAPEPFEKISIDAIESKEKQRLVTKAIESLPYKYRTVVVLKDIEGLGYADIARVLKCRIGTVESRLFRGRERLKKILAPLMEEGKL